MSHFTVAVITKSKSAKELEKLLEPYDENKDTDPYISRTKEQIIKEAKERKEKINNYYTEHPEKKEMRMTEWEQDYIKAHTDEELYDIEKDDYCDHDEEGNELSTYNPNSKWDWYSIGGRWNNIIIVDKDNNDVCTEGELGIYNQGVETTVEGHPELKKVNGARIKDIKFDMMGGDYDKAIRFWEIVVDGSKPQNEDEKNAKEWNCWNPKYYIDQYGNKEEYARLQSQFYTYALLDEKGWVEQEKMGWWGIDNATESSRKEYVEKFKEYIEAPENQEKYLFIVDCHI